MSRMKEHKEIEVVRVKPFQPFDEPAQQKMSTRKQTNTNHFSWKSSIYYIGCIIIFILHIFQLPLCSGTSQENENTNIRKQYISLISIPILERISPILSLAEGLISHGYRVSITIPKANIDWTHNIKDLEVINIGHYPESFNLPNKIEIRQKEPDVYDRYTQILLNYSLFQRPMFRTLLKEFSNDPPDLLVVDRFTFAGFDISHKLGISYVVNNPFMLMDLDDPPSYVPAPFSYTPMETTSVWKRCLNGYHRLRFRLSMMTVLRKINEVRSEFSLFPIRSKEQIYKGRMVLINSVFGMDFPRPMPPLIRMVGPLFPLSSKPLNPRLLNWIKKGSSPIVYIQFGDFALSREMEKVLIDTILKLNFRIIWSKPKNRISATNEASLSTYYIVEPLSKIEILRLEQVKCMISSGGYHSVLESLVAGKPILGIPVTGEQKEVMERIVQLKAGLIITPKIIHEHNIREYLQQLIDNDVYSKSSKHFGLIATAAGGTKYAIESILISLDLGTQDLIPEQHLQPLYRIYLLDVYIIYGAVLCGVAVILRTCWSACCSMFGNSNKKLKED